MASALQNPNDRRRINRIARFVAAHPQVSPQAAVDLYYRELELPIGQRKSFPRRGTGTGQASAEGKAKTAFLKAGKAKKSTEEQKAKLAKARRGVISALAERPNYGKGYASRATLGKAKRFRNGQKVSYVAPRGNTRPEWTIRKGKHKGMQRRVDAAAIERQRAYNAKRGVYRSENPEWNASSRTWARPGAPTWLGGAGEGPYKASGRALSMLAASKKSRKSQITAPSAAQQMMLPVVAEKSKRSRQAKANGLALTNGLALANPKVVGAQNYLLGYAIPVTVAGGVAGAAHAFLATSGLTEQMTGLVARIPVVGEAIADNAPYTLQGLLVGSGLALLAPMIGGKAGKYLALTGASALVVGGGVDAFNYLSGSADDTSDIDADIDAASEEAAASLSGVSALGDLAFTNGMGDLAFTNGLGGLADGMAYETAPLAASEYMQASFADAAYSGDDFSVDEGQALLNGRDAFLRRFDLPPHRQTGRSSESESHLAGREGHRWGWLIRMVGWQNAAKLAALPPARRVQFIAKFRRRARALFDQLVAEGKDARREVRAEAPVQAGMVASGAQGITGGAQGAGAGLESGFLGDPALFMGA